MAEETTGSNHYTVPTMETPWEYLGAETFRMAVPGGWLYRYKDRMLFVPTPPAPVPLQQGLLK